MNSNTTLVKVKYVVVIAMHGDIIIQIQHLLKLNRSRWNPYCSLKSIQIQHLLKLNAFATKCFAMTYRFKYNTC